MAQELVTNLVGKVVDSLFRKAKEEIGYMSNCSKNVEDLKKENENLTNMKGGVVQQIEAAKDKGDRLKDGVEKWVVDAESLICEAKEVIDGFEANANKTCFNLGMCTNLGTLYRYGKKAANTTPSLLKVQEDRNIFGDCVSVPTPAPGVLDVYDRHNIVDLDTHKSCFKKIIESIKDDNIQIIGIYGTGGVGKTTLAKEVALEVKSSDDERIKKVVEFITVSQPVDVKRIKKEVQAAAKRIQIVSLPPSLQQLTKLCMLNLGGNRSLRDISILGVLKSLEILILSYTGIVEIPEEIGDLVNLRRLEVKGCEGLSHIAPGVMSKLRWLEELHIDCAFKYGNYESLVEIGELSMLTFLDLFVPHIHLIPTEGVCFTKLKGFVIQIGGRFPVYPAAEVVHKKTLILKDHDKSSMLEVEELIKLSDGILFESVKIPNIVPTIYCERLDDLTTIMLSDCHNLLSLVEYSSNSDVDEELEGGENTKKQFFSKLEHLFLIDLDKLHILWNCPDQYISLKNLVTLNIACCNELVSLFSVSVARGLVNLQTLTIQGCLSLEKVIQDGDERDIDMVEFRFLVKLELIHLHNLESFYAGNVIIKCPYLVKVNVKGCNRMKTYDKHDLKLVNQIDTSCGVSAYYVNEDILDEEVMVAFCALEQKNRVNGNFLKRFEHISAPSFFRNGHIAGERKYYDQFKQAVGLRTANTKVF